MKFALFGAGRIGALHAGTLAAMPDTVLKFVSDPVAGAAQKTAAAPPRRTAPPGMAREKLPFESGKLLSPDVCVAFLASYKELCRLGGMEP